MYFIPKFGCRNKSIEIPVIVAVVICNKYSDALVKKLQLKDCTFAQKAGFSMHFHCRLTVKVCSVEAKRIKKGVYQVTLPHCD